jgi:hypothetical protein
MTSDLESIKWDSDALEMYPQRFQLLKPNSKGNIVKGKVVPEFN